MPLRLLYLLALAVRLGLLFQYPGVYGDDAAARLAYADRVILAYQLPLPQLIVVGMRTLAPHPAWTQVVFAAIGAAVAPLLAAIVGRLATPLAGRLAGVLASLHPAFVYYSLSPYQEGPMLALLLAAALLRLHDRPRLAAACVGLACLCRYEAWIAAALLAWRDRSWKAAAGYALVPLAWIGWWRGLSPGGTYVLDLDPDAGRLHRLLFLAAKTIDYGGPAIAVLGAIGAFLAWRSADRRWRMPVLFLAGVTAAVVLAGHEFPPGSGHVSERLVHLPALATCAAAALTVAHAWRRSSWLALAGTSLIAVIAIDAVRRTQAMVRTAHDAPDAQLARAVAATVEPRLGASGHVAVSAPPVAPAAIEAYMRKVGAGGGDVDRARLIARDLSRLPPDAVRVAAHLARPAGTVVAADEPASVQVAFDANAASSGDERLEFVAGGRRAVVYTRRAAEAR